MATLDAVFVFSGSPPIYVSALAANTASGEIVLGNRVLFAINATQDITISAGTSGMALPSSSNFRIPSGVTPVFDLGTSFDRIRVFNLSPSNAVNVYIQTLSKF